ncbi:MAG: 50S ribosomal protein L10 [Clostridia bacterium]|nr:50S ribosomal protein L10 [Clostridia bacterium]
MSEQEKMSVSKSAKREVVDEIKNTISQSQSFVLIDYKGLTVAQDTEFRKTFREAGVKYQVLKNTLVRIALNELGYNEFDEALNGPTAVAFGMTDALAPAKVADESITKYKAMQIKCGMMDKKFIDKVTVEQLAKVPAKPVLLSMLLSVLTAPVRGMAVALNRLAEKKGEQA